MERAGELLVPTGPQTVFRTGVEGFVRAAIHTLAVSAHAQSPAMDWVVNLTTASSFVFFLVHGENNAKIALARSTLLRRLVVPAEIPTNIKVFHFKRKNLRGLFVPQPLNEKNFANG